MRLILNDDCKKCGFLNTWVLNNSNFMAERNDNDPYTESYICVIDVRCVKCSEFIEYEQSEIK